MNNNEPLLTETAEEITELHTDKTAADSAAVLPRNYRKARILTLSGMAIIIIVTALLLFLLPRSVGVYTYTPDAKILLYHLVSDETYGDNEYLFVREADFEAQLAKIAELGLTTVFADELAEAGDGPFVVITFDDGYVDNYTTVLPLLRKYNMKATVFLIPDMVGKEGHLTEEQIREMAESGHFHFGSHTQSHKMLTTIDGTAVMDELTASRAYIEALTGMKITALAYPNGNYNLNVQYAAAEAGYRYCYTTEVPKDSIYENTRLPRHYVGRETTMAEFLDLLK